MNKVIEVPGEAVSYVVSHYLRKRSDGIPLVVGIPSDTVEDVIGLFFEWASSKNYVKDGVLTFSSEE